MELWMRISILAFPRTVVRHFSRHSKRWQRQDGWRFLLRRGLAIITLYRLNANGDVDPTFRNRCSGQADAVLSIQLQSDGKVLVAGGFHGGEQARPGMDVAKTQYRWLVGRHFQSGHKLPRWSHGRIIGGATKWKAADGGLLHRDWRSHFGGFARLESDGTLDGNFNPAGGVNGTVDSLLVQPNGKVLINGDFTSVNGASRNGIARLNHDGGLDATVSSGKRGVLPERVTAAALQADGKVLIGTEYGLARAHADGSLDGSFVASIRTGDDRWAVTALG